MTIVSERVIRFRQVEPAVKIGRGAPSAVGVRMAAFIKGDRGVDGVPGTGEIAAQATSGAVLAAGIPLCVNPADGKLVPALASSAALCRVIGLA
jgi:hypothetical protein